MELAQSLVVNENILLQTLGFMLHVEHPHSYVVKTTQMVRGMSVKVLYTGLCSMYRLKKGRGHRASSTIGLWFPGVFL